MNRDEQLEFPSSALPAAGRSLSLRGLAWTLLLGTIALTVSLLFVPWQQSIHGRGRVIAYAPLERRQAIEAPIDGRVMHFYVQEGDAVEKGQPILELSDNDPEILQRLTRERDAAQAQVNASTLSLSLMEAQIVSLEAARDSALLVARERVRIANDQARAAERTVEAAQATLTTAERNVERQRRLHARGLTSERDLELAELDATRARTEWERARAQARAADAEVRALGASQGQVASSNRASIESTRSALEKLRAERAKAEAELAKVEVRLARQQQMQVTAPRNGVIFRVIATQGAEMVKAGDPLVLLVPEAGSRAVELSVDGNDAPLVEEGRAVRLQFEGWPAVQFVGWPSVAVGTFGGKVAFVDTHADEQGRFRIVVVPEAGKPWPEERVLRQGVLANGWVLLDQVSLGFELWRQFNGFPPAVSIDKANDATPRSGSLPVSTK